MPPKLSVPKVYLLLFSFLLFSFTSIAQIVINPSFSGGSKDLNLIKFDNSSQYTILSFEYIFDSDFQNARQVRIDSNLCLTDNKSNVRYSLVKAEGIPVAPEKPVFVRKGEKFFFKLFFKKLDESVTSFDMDGCKQADCFSLYAVTQTPRRMNNIAATKTTSPTKSVAAVTSSTTNQSAVVTTSKSSTTTNVAASTVRSQSSSSTVVSAKKSTIANNNATYVDANTIKLSATSCSYFGESLPSEVYSFASDYEAHSALARITNASGLPLNFKLVAGNVPNACATVKYNEATRSLDRYIIYNQTFMQRIKSYTNDWAALSILAHEVGHHLSGHSLQAGGSRPSIELEADKFSGFIMSKLGASLDNAQTAINLLSTESGSSTHPPKSARLAAIANGWVQAGGQNNINSSNNARSSSTVNGGTKPDMIKVNISDLKWQRGNNNSHWLYHSPSNYQLMPEVDYLIINVGERYIFLIDKGIYVKFEDFDRTPFNVERTCKWESGYEAAFIRSANGGFWLYDRGRSVHNNIDLLSKGYNSQGDYVYVYRNRVTGKRYWIPHSAMNYGSYGTLIGIHSE